MHELGVQSLASKNLCGARKIQLNFEIRYMENCNLIPSFHFPKRKKNHHFLEKLRSFCDLKKELFELFQFVEKFHEIVRLHGILFLTLLNHKEKIELSLLHGSLRSK